MTNCRLKKSLLKCEISELEYKSTLLKKNLQSVANIQNSMQDARNNPERYSLTKDARAFSVEQEYTIKTIETINKCDFCHEVCEEEDSTHTVGDEVYTICESCWEHYN